jgi:septin family protein
VGGYVTPATSRAPFFESFSNILHMSSSFPLPDLEEKQFKVKLTIIDTPGFGDYVNNHDSWSPIVDFIDHQH